MIVCLLGVALSDVFVQREFRYYNYDKLKPEYEKEENIMLGKPEHGWCDVTIDGQMIGLASYLLFRRRPRVNL